MPSTGRNRTSNVSIISPGHRRRSWLVGLYLTCVLLAILIMPACALQTPQSAPESNTGPTGALSGIGDVKHVKLGCLSELSGPFAPIGVAIRNGILNAQDMINETGGFIVGGQRYQIDVIEYDNRTDPKRAVAGQLWMKDIYDIKMIMGPSGTAQMMPCQSVSEASHILHLTVASAEDVVRPGIKYSFVCVANARMKMAALAATLADVLETKTVGILTENYAYALDCRRQFTDEIKNRQGVQILGDEIVDSGTTDFSTPIARLRTKNPDVLLVFANASPTILIVKQIYEAGWHVVLAGPGELASDELFRVCGPAAEGVIAAEASLGYWQLTGGSLPNQTLEELGVDVPELRRIAARFVQKYQPNGLAYSFIGHSYLISLVECMQKAGTVDDGQQLRDSLLGMQWEDPMGRKQTLPTQRWNAQIPVAVYHQSSVGADKYDLLSWVTHTDEWQQNWVTHQIQGYKKIPGLRAERKY